MSSAIFIVIGASPRPKKQTYVREDGLSPPLMLASCFVRRSMEFYHPSAETKSALLLSWEALDHEGSVWKTNRRDRFGVVFSTLVSDSSVCSFFLREPGLCSWLRLPSLVYCLHFQQRLSAAVVSPPTSLSDHLHVQTLSAPINAPIRLSSSTALALSSCETSRCSRAFSAAVNAA